MKTILRIFLFSQMALAVQLCQAQTQEIYTTDFSGDDYGQVTGDIVFDNGTTTSSNEWFGSNNGVGIVDGDLSFANTARNRLRGSGVWIDTTGLEAGLVTVEVDVANFVAGDDTDLVFQAYGAAGVDASNTVSLDLHGSAGGANPKATGTATIVLLGEEQTITADGTDVPFTFFYNGTDNFIGITFAQRNVENASVGSADLDNLSVTLTPGVLPPPPTPTRFTRIDLDGSDNSLVNGSYEDVTLISGTSATGQIELSNSSFDNTDGNVYSVAQWSPAADDPNNIVGQYGDAGTVTTSSFYLDTNSFGGNGGPTDGARGILMNSAGGYVNRLVNEDILAALSLDPLLLSPNVQIKVTADVNRRNANTLSNDTATATLAITAGSTDADDVANAIAGGTASVVQGDIVVGDTTELELNLTGADFDTASQLNLVIQSVNSAAITLPETTAGQDLNQVSQVVFDNIVFTAYLPGDNDGDFDVMLDDLDQYIGNIGADGTGALLLLDLDGDGIVGANDFEMHYTDLVETSNGQFGTFAGDANLDGTVNVLGDAFALVANLGSASTSWAQGDFNGDGIVNVLGDAFILVANLGRSN